MGTLFEVGLQGNQKDTHHFRASACHLRRFFVPNGFVPWSFCFMELFDPVQDSQIRTTMSCIQTSFTGSQSVRGVEGNGNLFVPADLANLGLFVDN